MIRQAVVLAFVTGGVGLTSAQRLDDRFEVASVKPANPAVLYAASGSEGAVWRANNFTLFMLIELAGTTLVAAAEDQLGLKFDPGRERTWPCS